jgi:hypothetical protein
MSTTPARRNDIAAFFHRRRDRLLDHHMHAAFDAGERNLAVQVGRRRDRYRINAAIEQLLDVRYCRTTKRLPDELRLCLIRIGNGGELDARKLSEDAGVV